MKIRWQLLRQPIWAGLIGIAAYLTFWAIATLVELAARPPTFGSHASVTFEPLDRNGAAIRGLGPQTAEYQKPYRFVARVPDLRVAIGRVTLQFEAGAEQSNQALLLARRADILAARLNGRPLDPDMHTARLAGSFVSEPVLFRLPPAWLVRGENRIELDVRRSLRDPFLFPDFAVAPVSELLPSYNFRSLMIVEASIVGLALTLLILLLCGITDWPDAERSKMRAFICALASSLGIGVLILFVDVERVGLPAYAIAHSLLSLMLGTAALYYGLRDGVRGSLGLTRRMAWCAAAIVGISCVLISIYYTGLPGRFWLLGPSILAMLFAAFSLVLAAALLIWRSASEGWAYLAERFALVIWFGAVGFDRGETGLFALSSPFVPNLPLSLHWLQILGTIVGLAMLTVLAKQASEARAAIRAANERLTHQLAEREAELRRSYHEREVLLEHHATQNERQRIMRDMHDGLGSQLISMLLAARRGQAHPAQVADGLQAVIDEMRLMIDSMDSVGDSLGSALAIFRERIAPRIEAAGLQLEWTDRSDGNYPHYEPRELLHIFRIMQEAVANALKHAEATVLKVGIVPDPDTGFALRIAISDDGKGLKRANRPGKGLTSMTSRAAAIGGRLKVANDGQGVSVVLDLPEGALSTAAS